MIESVHSTLSGTAVASNTLVSGGAWLTVVNRSGAATLWGTIGFNAAPADPAAAAAGTFVVPSGAARDIYIGTAGISPVTVKILGNGNDISLERRP